jgi:hypothetical protein
MYQLNKQADYQGVMYNLYLNGHWGIDYYTLHIKHYALNIGQSPHQAINQ